MPGASHTMKDIPNSASNTLSNVLLDIHGGGKPVCKYLSQVPIKEKSGFAKVTSAIHVARSSGPFKSSSTISVDCLHLKDFCGQSWHYPVLVFHQLCQLFSPLSQLPLHCPAPKCCSCFISHYTSTISNLFRSHSFRCHSVYNFTICIFSFHT